MEQNPDVLIVDEAMLDEDEPFAAVYKREMNRLAAEGKTVFIISSSMTHLQELCGKVLWLEAGKLKDDGPTETILPAYEKFLQQPPETEEKTEEVPKSPPLQQSDTEHAPKEEQAAAAETRTARNKQIFSGKVIRYILIAVLFIAAVFAAMVYLERGKDQPASSGVLEPDIRYVTVQTATVRDNAEFGSKITGKASFGQAFKVLETQDSSAASVKWLKVEGVTTDLKGWISNKFLEKVKEKADGNTVAAAVDDLIGFTPSLEEAIPMIGKKKGKETAFDYTEYMYDEDKVTGFTITVNDASDTVLKEALGEPHLQRKDKLLYHGGKYDFLFTLHGTGVIDSLTVTKN
jgi:teichoic acid transport system ATP-binding protein